MQIKSKSKAFFGAWRQTHSFAWLPVTLKDNNRIWLEKYWFIERCDLYGYELVWRSWCNVKDLEDAVEFIEDQI